MIETKKTAGAILTLALLVTTVFAVPVTASAFAKDMRTPEGGEIGYYSGGNASITLPEPFPFLSSGKPVNITAISVIANHQEAGSIADKDYMIVYFYIQGTTSQGWVPWAFLTASSNPAYLDFIKAIWGKSPIYYYISPSVIWSNIFSGCDIAVERHGNSITANLASSKLIKLSATSGATYTLPAFTMELQKVGGSVHCDQLTTSLTKWGVVDDKMGFFAEGTFTTPTWSGTMDDCFITMHGIYTFSPPPPA